MELPWNLTSNLEWSIGLKMDGLVSILNCKATAASSYQHQAGCIEKYSAEEVQSKNGDAQPGIILLGKLGWVCFKTSPPTALRRDTASALRLRGIHLNTRLTAAFNLREIS